MYADRVEAEEKRSIKERLNGNVAGDSVRPRQVTGKRQRLDDKWEHDLYDDAEPQLSKQKLDARDLRFKLQRNQKAPKSGAVRDLREKLSGFMHAQPVNRDPPKPKPEPEASKPVRKSIIVEPSAAESTKVTNVTVKKKSQQKADASVDGFLQSLGLEKYLITFQAEEVDMTALEHMTDQDLKAMGIPMGPRKKILLALNSGT
ncbi:hypothetical protein Ancab_022077 [Ancistrocladus abbreviatus]